MWIESRNGDDLRPFFEQLMTHMLKAANYKLAVNYAVRLFNHQFEQGLVLSQSGRLGPDAEEQKEASKKGYSVSNASFEEAIALVDFITEVIDENKYVAGRNG